MRLSSLTYHRADGSQIIVYFRQGEFIIQDEAAGNTSDTFDTVHGAAGYLANAHHEDDPKVSIKLILPVYRSQLGGLFD